MANGKEQRAEGVEICKEAGIGSATHCDDRARNRIVAQVRLIPVNLHGLPVGEDHHLARWPDSLVAEARALRAQGLTTRAIAAQLGPNQSTVVRWVNGAARKPAVKVVARRVRSV